MKHNLEINLGKDGLKHAIETLLGCFNQDENAEHEYVLNIIDLYDDDDEPDEHTFTFTNFPDAIGFLSAIYTALRKGYEAGKEGGIYV